MILKKLINVALILFASSTHASIVDLTCTSDEIGSSISIIVDTDSRTVATHPGTAKHVRISDNEFFFLIDVQKKTRRTLMRYVINRTTLTLALDEHGRQFRPILYYCKWTNAKV